eukprot:GILI01003061.1.p1 GENE.GILI01003061.1~~GILI01003061.1.p1  ORF type:complete len:313 (+),score=91.86 GILI01003061.1:98-940(+)
MSNVHGLGSLERNNSRVPLSGGNLPQYAVPRGPPSYMEMFFPDFSWKSFILIISAVQIIIFFVSLGMGSTNGTPNICGLYKLGAKFAPTIAEGEVHRLVLPILLHGSVMHLFVNMFSQMRMGFTMEKEYGVRKLILLYFVSGIGASFLSCMAAPCVIGVGASGSLFGLLGSQIAYLYLNWANIPPPARTSMAFMLFFVILLNFLFGFSSTTIDNWAHLGGLVIGVLIALAMLPTPFDSSKQRRVRSFSVGLLAVYFGVSFGMVFAALNYSTCPAVGSYCN